MKIKICHRNATGSFYYTWVYDAIFIEEDGESMYVVGSIHTDAFNDEVGYWVKKIGGSWWLHHEQGVFFIDGRNIKIEDLNCDEMVQMVYTLKYDYVYDLLYSSKRFRYHHYVTINCDQF